MAANPHPPISDLVTIKEGLALLAVTGHPVTQSQLAHRLKDAQRERHGMADYYSISDVFVVHRDLVDRKLA